MRDRDKSPRGERSSRSPRGAGSDREKKGVSIEDKAFLASIRERLKTFVESEETKLVFEPLNSYKRRQVHQLAQEFGMVSDSNGEGDDRHNVITKTESTKVIAEIPDAQNFVFNYTQEFFTRKHQEGVDVCLTIDGSVLLDQGIPDKQVIARRNVNTGSFKIIDNNIVLPTDSTWR